MKKSLIALALVSAFAAPVFAQSADPSKDEAAPAGPHTLTGNIGLFSDYRFRGISQTFGKPAIQGGFDYSHSSGIYLGNWNSNVAQETGFNSGNIEMDFYGGWKLAMGDFGLDLGGIYYYYPGTDSGFYSPCNAKEGGRCLNGSVDNGELYIGGSWKTLSVKYYYAVTDYFGVPGTKGTQYFDMSGSYDLGGGWGVNGHVGYTALNDFQNTTAAADNGKYYDWKLGVTKDLSGWVVGVAYVGTNADGGTKNGGNEWYRYVKNQGTGKSIDAGRDTVVVSLTKAF